MIKTLKSIKWILLGIAIFAFLSMNLATSEKVSKIDPDQMAGRRGWSNGPHFQVTDYEHWLWDSWHWVASRLAVDDLNRRWVYSISNPAAAKTWYTIEFPDSTLIDVGPNSCVSYPSDFLKGDRYIIAEGDVNVITHHSTHIYLVAYKLRVTTYEGGCNGVKFTRHEDSNHSHTTICGQVFEDPYFLTPFQLIPGAPWSFKTGKEHTDRLLSGSDDPHLVEESPTIFCTPILLENEIIPNPKVSINGDQIPLDKILTTLISQTKCTIFCPDSLLRLYRPLHLALRNVPWRQTLDSIFKNQPDIDYMADSNGLLLVCITKSLAKSLSEGTNIHFKLDSLAKKNENYNDVFYPEGNDERHFNKWLGAF